MAKKRPKAPALRVAPTKQPEERLVWHDEDMLRICESPTTELPNSGRDIAFVSLTLTEAVQLMKEMPAAIESLASYQDKELQRMCEDVGEARELARRSRGG